MRCLLFLNVFVLCRTVNAAIGRDEISTLPGYVFADGYPKPLPTKHWSGYIEVKIPANSSSGAPAGSAFIHYWLVESSARRSDVPTVVWQQGGPGGSSLWGFFTENGPFTLNDGSFQTEHYKKTGIPTVFDNPSSWHAHANMLYVEHPAPTGFSYCVPAKACTWNDYNQALVNYQFYINFFDAYPELAKNAFYFTGESYAGVLVPTVALQILSHTTASNKDTAPWNLKGFMLGNDCPGNQIYTCTPYSHWRGVKVALDFRYGHGMIPDDLYREIYAACASWWSDKPFPADGHMGDDPPEKCKTLLEDPARPCMSVTGDTYEMGGGYYLYDTCQKDLMALNATDGLLHPRDFVAQAQFASLTASAESYPCGQERASQHWLNLVQVQKAINTKLVGKSNFDFSTESSRRDAPLHYHSVWIPGTDLNYTKTAWSLLPDYKEKLIPNYRILQFSGDADPCVPHVGTRRWIESLDLPKAKPWHPWSAAGSSYIAGYNEIYAGEGVHSSFTFATVRNAGHMVPRYKPAEALYMFHSFLSDRTLRGAPNPGAGNTAASKGSVVV